MNFMDRNKDLLRIIASSGDSCTTLSCATDAVAALFGELAERLPPEDIWRTRKREQGERCRALVMDNAALFGMTGLEVAVLGFVGFAHDIGRLEEARRRYAGEPYRSVDHGAYSEDLIRRALNFPLRSFEDGMREPDLPPLWKAIFSAVTAHSLPQMPERAAWPHGEAAYGLTGLLRDLDKLEGFRSAWQYTHDAAFKLRQAEQNWPHQRETDPAWGTEMQSIVPAGMLDCFFGGRPLVRAECRSYEAYMLQYLSWIFDVVNAEVLELIMREQGPQVVLGYLFAQLGCMPATRVDFTAIRLRVNQYLMSRDLRSAVWMP